MHPGQWFATLLTVVALVSCNSEGTNRKATGDSDGSFLRFARDGKPVLQYAVTEQLRPDTLPAYYARSGYIDSVYSPAGRLLTDAFPVGHTHQHGIFTAWTNTTFRGEHLDFWNQQDTTGTVRHREVKTTHEGSATSGFEAIQEQVSRRFGPVLRDRWHVRLHRTRSGAPHVWDLRSEQENITADTLYLNRHTYGGLGVRGSAEWNPADSLRFRSPARFLTSEGAGREAANHTRPRWTAIYGELSGPDGSGVAGIAVFPHPDDRHGPRFVRVHPEMPYLSVTPVAREGFALAPGERYLSRFRFVTFDGEPDPAVLNAYGWDELSAADDPGM